MADKLEKSLRFKFSGDSSTQKVGSHFGAKIDLGGATENCV